MRVISSPTSRRQLPAVRYRDVAGAIDWLSNVFGLERHEVVTAKDGAILHAWLTLGDDLLLLLPMGATSSDADMSGAESSVEAQGCYLVVDDIVAFYRNAISAGADDLEIVEDGQRGRVYSCRDPEGHIWSFGTHDPQATNSNDETEADGSRSRAITGFRRLGERINPLVALVSTLVMLIGAAMIALLVTALSRATPDEQGKVPTATSSSPRGEETTDRIGEKETVNRPVVKLIEGSGGELRISIQAPRSTETEREVVSTPQRNDERRGNAEQTAEEALRKLREAQQAAAAALKQLRHEQKEAGSSARPETQESLAASSQQQAAEKIVTDFNKEPASPAEAKKSDTNPPQLTKAQGRPDGVPGRSNDVWDCRPSPPAGQIVCHPNTPKPTSAKTAATQKSDPKKGASGQIWDCQPVPPSGQLVCRPMAASR
jgi:uncharacterized glyoxalase superfamily protein PhnB